MITAYVDFFNLYRYEFDSTAQIHNMELKTCGQLIYS